MEDAGGSDEDPEAYEEQRAHVEQSERLLQQMRKCVLVHHQLSCLLIHGTAMRAGLYKDGGEGPVVAGESFAEGASIERSIQNLGGSTARLFSMALHDSQDLQAMAETLQERVDDMIQGARGELKLAGYTAPSFDSALEDDSPGGFAGGGAAASHTPEAREAREVAELSRECEALESDLALEHEMVNSLAHELGQVRLSAEHANRSLTAACFDEVRRAEERNEALEILLLRLHGEAKGDRKECTEAALREAGLPPARAELPPIAEAEAIAGEDDRVTTTAVAAASAAAVSAVAFEVSLRQLDEQVRGRADLWEM